MKKLICLLMFACLTNIMFGRKIVITVSEPDAEIFVNGKKVGYSPQTIRLDNGERAYVEIKKLGFITETLELTIGLDKGKNGIPDSSKSQFVQMKKDESYESSAKTDNANVDFAVEVNKKLNETDAWKLANQIVRNYIDDIVQVDKETGYLMTAWKVQTFPKKTIRTRVILKLSNSHPLTYKIKIESQYSDEEGLSAKADEKFRDWDRILKKYDSLIGEFQVRLGVK